MRTTIFRRCILALIAALAFSAFIVSAQQGDKKKAQPAESQAATKIGADLVMVPALATDSSDSYVPDLRKEEFTILEDGVKQEIAFFASIKESFHIVLLIDTGLSLNPEDLRRVKMAAREFLEQIRGSDLVSVVYFNDSVKEACGFTGDYSILRNAINGIPPGGGTKVYDAMTYALGSLKRAKAKRSAIIVLTDGVDWHSDSASSESSVQELEESGVLVFPIRYDNRSQIETMLRKQKAPNFDAVFGAGGIGSAIPTAAPAETPGQTQQSGQPDKDPSYKLPMPTGQPRGRDRNRYPDGRYPDGKDLPLPGEPSRQPDMRKPPDPRDYPDNTRPASDKPKVPTPPTSLPANAAEPTLDSVYKTADQYLKGLADITGGELHRTEKITDLPDIFQRIASDLRNQYSLGYYSTNAVRDGNYRKIKVQTIRKDTVIRARPSYRPAEPKK